MARTDRAIAAAGFMCVAAFGLLVVLLHDLRPDLDPGRHFISEYALGPYAALMVTAFAVLGVGKFLIAQALAHTASGRAVPWILRFDGAMVFLVALFPTDPPGGGPTAHGAVHAATALASFLASLAAAFVFLKAIRRDPQWKDETRMFRFLAWTMLAAFLVYMGATFAHVLAGAAQRLFVGSVLAWLGLAARRAAGHT